MDCIRVLWTGLEGEEGREREGEREGEIMEREEENVREMREGRVGEELKYWTYICTCTLYHYVLLVETYFFDSFKVSESFSELAQSHISTCSAIVSLQETHTHTHTHTHTLHFHSSTE